MKESDVQKQIVSWFKYTQNGGLIYATQNETIFTTLKAIISVLNRSGVRSGVIAIVNGLLIKIFKKFQSMGLLSGASDLNVIMPNGKLIFVEVKFGKNKQSDSQKEFQKRVEKLGFDYWLVYSLDEFIILVEKKQQIN